jgi:tripartite-type tricarboxylate transporter receptor subunit TctC
VVERLNGEFNAALKEPAVKERLAHMGMEAAGGSSEELGKTVVEEVRLWANVVKQQNLRFD